MRHDQRGALSVRRLASVSAQVYLPESLSEATEYPIGVEFDVRFDLYAVRFATLVHGRLRLHTSDGVEERIEVVDIRVEVIRPGVFLVSWVEGSGAKVVQLQDFAQGCLHSHVALPDAFLRMQSAITFVCESSPVSAVN